jgi:beta-lactam-binding protein with PASTA domain
VPNLINLTSENAQTILESQGLVLGTIYERNDEVVEAGRILSQSPEAGTSVLPGRAIAVAVSLGPKYAVVPDLAGKSQSEAETALTAAGLLLGAVTEAYHPTVAAGLVISQQPTQGSGVNRGTEVDLTLSKGIEPVIEGEGEGEGEGETEGEDKQPKGCLASFQKTDSFAGSVKRVISDWLLLGLGLMVLAAFTQTRK